MTFYMDTKDAVIAEKTKEMLKDHWEHVEISVWDRTKENRPNKYRIWYCCRKDGVKSTECQYTEKEKIEKGII